VGTRWKMIYDVADGTQNNLLHPRFGGRTLGHVCMYASRS